MERVEAIRSLSLFRDLPEEQVRELAEISRVRTFAKGERIFSAGDKAGGFYALVQGMVRVFRSSPSGKEQILHLIKPGEAFGEVAVFEGRTFPADAEALESSRVFFFSRDDFLRQARRDPELAMQMLALMARRLRTFVTQVTQLSLKEVPARLAAYLLLMADSSESETVRLDMSKGQVACYLGTIQETLSRTFRRLEEDGLISVNGRAITLRDRNGLQALAEEGR